MSEPTDTPDEVVAGVADSIRGAYGVQPLSEEERWQREIDNAVWQARQQRRAEQQQLEHQRIQAEADERARQKVAIIAEQARQRANREASERYSRQQRQRQLDDLQSHARQQAAWRRNVESGIIQQQRQAYRNALIADLENSINPPPPPTPEPVEVVVVEEKQGPWPEIKRWFT